MHSKCLPHRRQLKTNGLTDIQFRLNFPPPSATPLPKLHGSGGTRKGGRGKNAEPVGGFRGVASCAGKPVGTAVVRVWSCVRSRDECLRNVCFIEGGLIRSRSVGGMGYEVCMWSFCLNRRKGGDGSVCRCGIPFIVFLFVSSFFLFISQSYAAQITLAWSPVSTSSVQGYKIYYGTTSGSYGYSAGVGKATSYTISGLQDGKTYYCAVTSYTSLYESAYSNEVKYSTAPASSSSGGTSSGGRHVLRFAVDDG